MYNDTKMYPFELLNLATANKATPTTFVLSYPTAAVYSNRPSNVYQIPLADGLNGFVLHGLLKDTTGDAVNDMDCVVNLWGWSPGYGGGVLISTFTMTAGTAVLGTAAAPGLSPVDGSALVGQWGYAQSFATSFELESAEIVIDDSADGIGQLVFYPRGMRYLYADFDLDAGSSEPDDAMLLIRGY